MSTSYSWEGIRQVCATLFGARHVPERLCGGRVYWGAISSARPLPLPLPCSREGATKMSTFSALASSSFAYSLLLFLP